MKLFIYLLSDPRANKPMYVGMSKDPKKRLASHLCKSQLRHRSSKRVLWLKELLFHNLKPVLHILEEVNENNANVREVHWIRHFKEVNPDLTNSDLNNTNNPIYGEKILNKYESRPKLDINKELTISYLMNVYECNKKLADFIIKCHDEGSKI
jgi:hypothetical protein